MMICACPAVWSQDNKQPEAVNYVPDIHGTLRARYEAEFSPSESRFQVRNARVSISGRIARPISYFFNTDLCDRGKMKILDAWGKVAVGGGLDFQAGQFRMPFGVDPFRAPDAYYFSNRSFIAKQMCNYRAVGAKIGWHGLEEKMSIEAGAFNPSTIGDHEVWNRRLAYAVKGTYRLHNVTFATGFQSLEPAGTRTNLVDGSISWTHGAWIAEGEYMHKHYTHATHKPSDAWMAFGAWWTPVKVGVFNRLSLHGRVDGLSDHWDSNKYNDEGHAVTTDAARTRMTGGLTLSYIERRMHCDLRLDGEYIRFHHGVTAPQGQRSKIVAELIVRF